MNKNWKDIIAAASFAALATGGVACGGSSAEAETETMAAEETEAAGGCAGCAGYAEGTCAGAMEEEEALEGGCAAVEEEAMEEEGEAM